MARFFSGSDATEQYGRIRLQDIQRQAASETLNEFRLDAPNRAQNRELGAMQGEAAIQGFPQAQQDAAKTRMYEQTDQAVENGDWQTALELMIQGNMVPPDATMGNETMNGVDTVVVNSSQGKMPLGKAKRDLIDKTGAANYLQQEKPVEQKPPNTQNYTMPDGKTVMINLNHPEASKDIDVLIKAGATEHQSGGGSGSSYAPNFEVEGGGIFTRKPDSTEAVPITINGQPVKSAVNQRSLTTEDRLNKNQKYREEQNEKKSARLDRKLELEKFDMDNTLVNKLNDDYRVDSKSIVGTDRLINNILTLLEKEDFDAADSIAVKGAVSQLINTDVRALAELEQWRNFGSLSERVWGLLVQWGTGAYSEKQKSQLLGYVTSQKAINDEVYTDIREFYLLRATAAKQNPSLIIPGWKSLDDIIDIPARKEVVNGKTVNMPARRAIVTKAGVDPDIEIVK